MKRLKEKSFMPDLYYHNYLIVNDSKAYIFIELLLKYHINKFLYISKLENFGGKSLIKWSAWDYNIYHDELEVKHKSLLADITTRGEKIYSNFDRVIIAPNCVIASRNFSSDDYMHYNKIFYIRSINNILDNDIAHYNINIYYRFNVVCNISQEEIDEINNYEEILYNNIKLKIARKNDKIIRMYFIVVYASEENINNLILLRKNILKNHDIKIMFRTINIISTESSFSYRSITHNLLHMECDMQVSKYTRYEYFKLFKKQINLN